MGWKIDIVCANISEGEVDFDRHDIEGRGRGGKRELVDA